MQDPASYNLDQVHAAVLKKTATTAGDWQPEMGRPKAPRARIAGRRAAIQPVLRNVDDSLRKPEQVTPTCPEQLVGHFRGKSGSDRIRLRSTSFI